MGGIRVMAGAALAIVGAAALSAMASWLSSPAVKAQPHATRHFAADRNFDADGRFTPADAGFDLADVAAPDQLAHLPPGVQGLVWVGSCGGADEAFVRRLDAFAGHPEVFGFYLMDDPDPTGHWHPLCPASNLRAEADWIHAKIPGARTFVALMNMGTSEQPSLVGTYNPANTHVDLFGLAAYPCRTEPGGCDLDMIDRFVAAAHEADIPHDRIVPILQTFGGGEWRVDGSRLYAIPDAQQMAAILQRWADLVPAPMFDYAYSWSSQRGDLSLAGDADLRQVFRAHNGGGAARIIHSLGPQTATTSDQRLR